MINLSGNSIKKQTTIHGTYFSNLVLALELECIHSQQLVCKIVIDIKAKKIFISVLDELKIDLRNKNQSWSIQL